MLDLDKSTTTRLAPFHPSLAKASATSFPLGFVERKKVVVFFLFCGGFFGLLTLFVLRLVNKHILHEITVINEKPFYDLALVQP